MSCIALGQEKPKDSSAAEPVQQRERTLRLDLDPVATNDGDSIKIPRGYAVVIGVARYQNLSETQQLQFAERDAEAIYSTLISTEGGNFRAENVHKLIGSKATLTNIRKELEEWLPGIAKEEDRVVVYFAGHGFVGGGQAYLRALRSGTGQHQHDRLSGWPLELCFRQQDQGVRWEGPADRCVTAAPINPEADVQTINRSLMNLNQSLLRLLRAGTVSDRSRVRTGEAATVSLRTT
jgi:hypothetical protein